MARKTGARGLRSIVEAALLDTMARFAIYGRRRKSGDRRGRYCRSVSRCLIYGKPEARASGE